MFLGVVVCVCVILLLLLSSQRITHTRVHEYTATAHFAFHFARERTRQHGAFSLTPERPPALSSPLPLSPNCLQLHSLYPPEESPPSDNHRIPCLPRPSVALPGIPLPSNPPRVHPAVANPLRAPLLPPHRKTHFSMAGLRPAPCRAVIQLRSARQCPRNRSLKGTLLPVLQEGD